MFDGSRLVRPRRVTGLGRGLTSRAGLWWLATMADRLGLTRHMMSAMAGLSWRDHHPGRTLTYVILALCDGATAVSDVVNLRGLASLFGPVASTSTVWRTFDQVRGVHLVGLVAADNAARETAWRTEPDRNRLVIDMDATIVTTRTDKADAAPTYKRTYGFHRASRLLGRHEDKEVVMV